MYDFGCEVNIFEVDLDNDKDGQIRFDIQGEESIRSDLLEAIPFDYADSATTVAYETDEFTSVCPMTGLPDYGKITISYTPDNKIIELKSLKYYLLQYRNVGIFYEHLVNRILDDLVRVLAPKQIEVTGEFSARGGITTMVKANYDKKRKK